MNVADAVCVRIYIFRGGPAPICLREGDANGDTFVNAGDVVYVFKQSKPLAL